MKQLLRKQAPILNKFLGSSIKQQKLLYHGIRSNQKNEFSKAHFDNGFATLKIKNILISLHHGFCNWKNIFSLEVYGKTFSGFGKTQKSTIDNFMELATPLIYSNIKPKGYAEFLC